MSTAAAAGDGPGTGPGDQPGGAGDQPGTGPRLDAALQQLAARRPLLVALDFDGVCAPLVDDPAASRMLPGTRAVMGRLDEAGCRVALLSGRALASLVAVADPEPGWLVVGGHGAETMTEPDPEADPEGDRGPGQGRGEGRDAAAAAGAGDLPADELPVDADPGLEAVRLLDDDQAALLVEITAEVEAIVDGAPGAAVEHKPTAVVLHTRLVDPETALHTSEAVLEGPGGRPGVHVKRGKDVVELAVLRADKGSALQLLRGRTGAAAVLYAGDDVTDEDAFGVLDPDAGDVAVKVGPGPTAAAYRVGTPQDVTGLLERLAELLDRG